MTDRSALIAEAENVLREMTIVRGATRKVPVSLGEVDAAILNPDVCLRLMDTLPKGGLIGRHTEHVRR